MLEEIETVVGLLDHPGFRTGLVTGLIGLGVLVISGLLSKRPLPGWGLVFAMAATSGLMIESDLEQASLASLVILAAIGLPVDLVSPASRSRVSEVLRFATWIVMIAAVVWFTLATGVEGSWWIPIAYPTVVVTLAAGLWSLGRSSLADLLGPLTAISVVGAWVTVPETDNFNVILGAVLPLAIATLRPIHTRLLFAGALATSAVFAWLVLDGGAPRVWTVLVGWATLATLPVIYAVSRIKDRALPASTVVLTHLVYVIAITRVADNTRSVVVVMVWFVILIALVAGVVWLLATPSNAKRPEL